MRDVADNWFASFKIILYLIILMWLVEAVNNVLSHRLNVFGIYPRDPHTLPGIFLWPFLHGNFQHLIVNTTPLFVLGFFVALRGAWVFLKSALLILVFGGLGVWIFG